MTDSPTPVRWVRDPTALFMLALTAMVMLPPVSPLVWRWADQELRRRAAAHQHADTWLVAARVMAMLGTVMLGLLTLWLIVGGCLAVVGQLMR